MSIRALRLRGRRALAPKGHLELLVLWHVPFGPQRRLLWESAYAFDELTLGELARESDAASDEEDGAAAFVGVGECCCFGEPDALLTGADPVSPAHRRLTVALPAAPSQTIIDTARHPDAVLAYSELQDEVFLFVKWRFAGLNCCSWVALKSLARPVVLEFFHEIQFVSRLWESLTHHKATWLGVLEKSFSVPPAAPFSSKVEAFVAAANGRLATKDHVLSPTGRVKIGASVKKVRLCLREDALLAQLHHEERTDRKRVCKGKDSSASSPVPAGQVSSPTTPAADELQSVSPLVQILSSSSNSPHPTRDTTEATEVQAAISAALVPAGLNETEVPALSRGDSRNSAAPTHGLAPASSVPPAVPLPPPTAKDRRGESFGTMLVAGAKKVSRVPQWPRSTVGPGALGPPVQMSPAHYIVQKAGSDTRKTLRVEPAGGRANQLTKGGSVASRVSAPATTSPVRMNVPPATSRAVGTSFREQVRTVQSQQPKSTVNEAARGSSSNVAVGDIRERVSAAMQDSPSALLEVLQQHFDNRAPEKSAKEGPPVVLAPPSSVPVVASSARSSVRPPPLPRALPTPVPRSAVAVPLAPSTAPPITTSNIIVRDLSPELKAKDIAAAVRRAESMAEPALAVRRAESVECMVESVPGRGRAESKAEPTPPVRRAEPMAEPAPAVSRAEPMAEPPLVLAKPPTTMPNFREFNTHWQKYFDYCQRLARVQQDKSLGMVCLCRLRRATLHAELERALQRTKVGKQLLESNKIKCCRCSLEAHAVCHLKCLEWQYIHDVQKNHLPDTVRQFVNERSMENWTENFVCAVCKLTASDPFSPVEKLFSLTWIAPAHNYDFVEAPPPYSASLGGRFDCSLRVLLNATEAHQLLERKFKLQLRCIRLRYDGGGGPSSVGSCYPKYPNGNCEIRATYGTAEKVEVLRKPPNMRLRHDKFLYITDDLVRMIATAQTSGRQPFVRVCGDFDGISDGPYLLALAVVRETDTAEYWQRELVQTVQAPYAVCEQFVRKVFFETKTATDAKSADSDDELDVLDFATRIKLSCPSTMLRIDNPVRSVHCLHVQCFDLEYYVHSQNTIHQSQRWRCPLCGLSCKPNELILDTWYKSLLAATSEDDKIVDVNEVDGQIRWTVVRAKTEPAHRDLPKTPAAAPPPAAAPAFVIDDEDG